VEITRSGVTNKALLDTGFPHSVLAPFDVDNGLPLPTFTPLGGAFVGPLHVDFFPLGGTDLQEIVGADVLSVVPMVMDARAAQTRILLEFTPGAGAGPLARWATDLCRGEDPESGREGPDLLMVEANLDGVPLTLAVDTGADITLVRQSALSGLSSRPSLSGLPVHTGFAGDFTATVTRAKALTVGGQTSAGSPVLAGPQIDQGLDDLLHQFHDPPERLDGALGWTFLREFEVSFALGDDAFTNRALGLTRFDTQTHWTRDFVGIGVVTSQSQTLPGLEIKAFLSNSPARTAGLEVGDVILSINSQPATLSLPQPWGQLGQLVLIEFQHPGGLLPLTALVPITDLLPDPQ
jgi:hypothetical protein